MSKNILFITPDFYPNTTGFANASYNLVKTIRENCKGKYHLYVYCEVGLQEYNEVEGVTVFRSTPLKYNKGTRLFAEKKRYNYIESIINDNSIDVIFFETNLFPFLQNWMLKKFGSKVYVRIHSTADTEVQVFIKPSTIGSLITSRLVRKYMTDVRNVITTSDYYTEFVKHFFLEDNVYRIWENKTYWKIHNTADVTYYSDNVPDSNTFLTMGKMSMNGVVQKGITDLICAINRLKIYDELPDDFKLIIIGKGDCESVILNTIEKLGCGKYIDIIPEASHDEVMNYISLSRACVLVSRYEGQSMFVTESLALGKPLLITGGNGMSNLVIEGKNGFKVKMGDIDEISQGLYKLTSLPTDVISSMGEESRKLYESTFSPEAVYKQFDECMSFS